MKWICLALLLIGSASAQVPGFGPCPNVVTKQDFNPDLYTGKWYEAQRYFAIFELGGTCVTAVYNKNNNGTLSVTNRQINSITRRPQSITGEAVPEADPSRLKVTFPSVPGNFGAPYWILDTDYQSFAVVWSCTDIRVVNAKFAWILTREQNPPQAVLQKAYDVFNRQGLDRSHLRETKQTDCPAEKDEASNTV